MREWRSGVLALAGLLVAAPAPAKEAGGRPAPSPARVEKVGRWGIEIEVPGGARSEHEAAAGRHSVQLPDGASVTLQRVDVPAPRSLAEARRPWDADRDTKGLGEGTTADGAFYGIRTFRVRVGSPGMPGQTIHYWKTVSRVYADLPLDDQHHVSCTGFVEHGVDSASDPAIQSVAKVCLSMRRSSK